KFSTNIRIMDLEGCYNGFFYAGSVTLLDCISLQFYFTLNRQFETKLCHTGLLPVIRHYHKYLFNNSIHDGASSLIIKILH
ncbi:hypothetical protein, partial [Lacrimispora amygdalina]|uniref:hypothetical protein n=1 Tax=Lacrimispora amygdalina TaxID=253257 RepID=UPI001A9A522D